MISYLLEVEQHRTQIVIHALLKCQQENLYHEQNVTHISTTPSRTCQAYSATSPHPTRQFLTESLVDGGRSQSKSFSSCARIGRNFSFSASSPLRFNSNTSSSNYCFIKIIFRLIRNIRKCELLRHGSDKTLQVGYANHFYRSAHKFEQICRHRLRRQNVGYSNFSQPQSHLSFSVLLQYLVERRRVVTQLGKLD